jgi:gas vesicle protein
MSTGKVVIGVLAGITAGIILGVLFAPAEGTETRKKIKAKGSDVLEDLKNKFNELLADIEVTPETPGEESHSEKK